MGVVVSHSLFLFPCIHVAQAIECHEREETSLVS